MGNLNLNFDFSELGNSLISAIFHALWAVPVVAIFFKLTVGA